MLMSCTAYHNFGGVRRDAVGREGVISEIKGACVFETDGAGQVVF